MIIATVGMRFAPGEETYLYESLMQAYLDATPVNLHLAGVSTDVMVVGVSMRHATCGRDLMEADFELRAFTLGPSTAHVER